MASIDKWKVYYKELKKRYRSFGTAFCQQERGR